MSINSAVALQNGTDSAAASVDVVTFEHEPMSGVDANSPPRKKKKYRHMMDPNKTPKPHQQYDCPRVELTHALAKNRATAKSRAVAFL